MPSFRLGDKLRLELELECESAPGARITRAHFTFRDTTARVTAGRGDSPEDRRELGEVSGAVGGFVIVRDNRTETNWALDPRTLWYAVQAALEHLQPPTDEEGASDAPATEADPVQ